MILSPDWNDLDLIEPAIFWFWNDSITPDQIDRMLDDFLAKGIRAVYLHPMPQSFRPADFFGGMTVDYLSKEFFDLVDHATEAMRRRGMILWLYDEGGWPSGTAGGEVVAEDPSFGIWVLERRGDGFAPMQLLDQTNYPDLMNPAATDCFIRKTHEAYRRHIGREFGRTVRGIFTDEPRLLGEIGTQRIPWSPLVPNAFAARHGASLDSVAPLLFCDAPPGEQTRRVRRDYIKTISTLIADNYYSRIRQWCESHGLIFEGHHSGEDEFSRHGRYFGDYLQQAHHYHIPGVDAIWRQIFPGQPGGNYVGLASSASWLGNKRIALSESFAVYGAGLTLEQMRWIGGFQMVRGVNKIGVMAALQGTAGGRRIGTCSDISPKNPIWRDVDLWYDFIRNAARFSVRGAPRPRIGIYYRPELIDENHSAEFDRLHERICDRVHDSLGGLVFVGLDDLAKADITPGGLMAGTARISVLILHVEGELDQGEAAAMSRLRENGVSVVDARELENVDLHSFAPIHVNRKLKGIRLLAISQENWRGYLFFNEGAAPIEFTFELPGPDDAAPIDLRELPLDGNMPSWVRPIKHRSEGFIVHLFPGECRALESTSEPQAVPAFEVAKSRTVDAPWEVSEELTFRIDHDIEIIAPERHYRACTLGDYSLQDPDFSGSLLYRTNLSLPPLRSGSRLLLDLGTVFYSAEVWLNGRLAGRRAWSPFWFDITDHVKTGLNELQVRTTNTLANQWLRHDVHHKDMTRHRNMYLEKTRAFIADSLHAGLAGPVHLSIYSPVDPPDVP
jgi:hypothetical protein